MDLFRVSYIPARLPRAGRRAPAHRPPGNVKAGVEIERGARGVSASAPRSRLPYISFHNKERRDFIADCQD